jgi:hypothetical protein
MEGEGAKGVRNSPKQNDKVCSKESQFPTLIFRSHDKSWIHCTLTKKKKKTRSKMLFCINRKILWNIVKFKAQMAYLCAFDNNYIPFESLGIYLFQQVW